MINACTLRVVPTVMAHLHEIAGAALPFETGGILLGYRTPSEIVVVDALEVPDSKAHRFGYTRRRRPAQEMLDVYRAGQPSSSDVGWVGDFHSHPADQPASKTDMRTLMRSARADGRALCMLILARTSHSWVTYGYAAVNGTATRADPVPTL